MLLVALERLILQNRGAVYEADVFSVLLRCPWVIRSFEFALADGAIDCRENSADDYLATGFADESPFQSYARRFFDCDSHFGGGEEECRLVLFDVKSTTARSAGSQRFFSTVGQSESVSFYVCVCATDASFVEVIPNTDQWSGGVIGVHCTSFLRPSSYGVDPAHAPYQMPLSCLLEAFRRIRLVA